MRSLFNRVLLEIAEKNDRIYMILADIGFGEIEEFAQKFPDRFFNVGVAEQNMTGVACGVAMEGNIAIARAMCADLKKISKHETFGKINAVASIASHVQLIGHEPTRI